MAHLVPIPFLLVCVILLIRAELQENQRAIRILKPVATGLVILIAALSLLTPAAQTRYTTWILVGLGLSFVGDMALMFPSPKAFMLGLVAFVLAHVAYAIVFTVYSGFQTADVLTALILLLIGVLVYRKLLTNVGGMKIPVAIYMVVICVMVNRACSLFFADGVTTVQVWLAVLGALSFWISDLMLGINRFGRPFSWSRMSLAFYYTGQLLIALSAAYFGEGL